MKGQEEWKKVALTSYHALRSALQGYTVKAELEIDVNPDAEASARGRNIIAKATASRMGAPVTNSDLDHADRHGFRPKASAKPLQIESPPRLMHHEALEDNRKLIQVYEGSTSARHLQTMADEIDGLNKKTAFFDQNKHILGEIYMASGFGRRSAGGERLDWAFITVHSDRQGQNVIPPGSEWVKQQRGMFCPFRSEEALSYYPYSSLRGSDLYRSKVYRVGATSGPRAACRSSYATDCWIEGDRQISSECTLIGDNTWPGDSRAVVFNEHGELLGLLVGGLTPHNSHNVVCFATPIQDIFEDIKKFSEGEIMDIRVATT